MDKHLSDVMSGQMPPQMGVPAQPQGGGPAQVLSPLGGGAVR
jgi:hypothetical protein